MLEVLAARGEAGVTEVASEIAVHKSTAFRLLGALEGGGLVEQTGHRGKYRLGFGLIPLAGAVSDRLDVVQQGRAVCTRLATELGETVNVAVLRDHFAVNVDQARGPSQVATHNWIGQLTPLHCTSSGKVLLAHLDPATRADLLVRAGHRADPAHRDRGGDGWRSSSPACGRPATRRPSRSTRWASTRSPRRCSTGPGR